MLFTENWGCTVWWLNRRNFKRGKNHQQSKTAKKTFVQIFSLPNSGFSVLNRLRDYRGDLLIIIRAKRGWLLANHQDNKESIVFKLPHNGHKLENNCQEEALSFVQALSPFTPEMIIKAFSMHVRLFWHPPLHVWLSMFFAYNTKQILIESDQTVV